MIASASSVAEYFALFLFLEEFNDRFFPWDVDVD